MEGDSDEQKVGEFNKITAGDSDEQNIGELSDELFLFKEMTWKIPKNKILSNTVDRYFRSSSFTFAGSTWIFNIYPYGRTVPKSEGWIEFVIDRLKYETPEQYVYFQIWFETFRRKAFGFVYASFIFDAHQKFRRIRHMPKDYFLYNQKIVIIGDSITMVCQMRIEKINGVEKFSQTESVDSLAGCGCILKHPSPLAGTKTLQDFKQLFLKKEDCDVILKVKGQEFQAHKNILKARSPVFASKFKHLEKKAIEVINIDDCDSSFFSDFLCFLYCGNIEIVSKESACSLFTIAGKYDVHDLRLECMEFIKTDLSVDTFCDILALALKYSEKALIELTTDFFVKNIEDIIITDKWQSFLVENPIQSNELLIKALVVNKK